MVTVELTITHPAGLHARPASKFVKLASSFPCTIEVIDLTKGSAPVNAKSILGIFSLGVDQGHTIRINADGKDESIAINALKELTESNFGE